MRLRWTRKRKDKLPIPSMSSCPFWILNFRVSILRCLTMGAETSTCSVRRCCYTSTMMAAALWAMTPCIGRPPPMLHWHLQTGPVCTAPSQAVRNRTHTPSRGAMVMPML